MSKFLGPHYFYLKCWILFLFGSMIDTGQKFLSAPSALITVTLKSRLQTWNLNVKVFIKVFKTSLFSNVITDLIHLWYGYTYWSKILHSTIHTTLGLVKVKVTDLEFFMLKFYVEVFSISLILNYMMDLVPIWYHGRYWSKHFISTISTRDHGLEVDITDLEFKC